jgi:Bacterial TSP3 repeat
LVASGGDDGHTDGLTNLEEYLNQTNPNDPDSDGDDATDGVEVSQGSDPNNPADGGNPPPDPVESVEFKVGGDYASWRMEIKSLGPRDTRTLLVVSPAPGTWETKSHKLWKNNKYEVTMHHTGSRPQDDPPWYCWEGRIEGLPETGSFEVLPDYQLGARTADGTAFVIKNHWIVDNQEGLLTSHLHSKGSNHVGARKAILNPVEMITPAGDPVNAAADAGTGGTVPDGANEFTYSTAATGVLTVKLKAKAIGIGLLTPAEQEKFLFDLDAIKGSTFAWSLPANAGGKATITGDLLTATATYTALPPNTAAFGLKKARIKYDGVLSVEKNFEVFFPRDASNHAGGTAGTKNWFHYWLLLIPGHDVVCGGASAGASAEVKGMTGWNYTTAPNKIRITLYNAVTGKFKSYGVGEEFSGIDRFMGTLKHGSSTCGSDHQRRCLTSDQWSG